MTGLPDISWFRNPSLTEPTPLTFERSGRVFGHAALWGSSHRSYPGRRITPPRSRTDYSMYHVGSTLVVGDDGEPTTIATGNLAEGGHADTSMGMSDTQAFYDDPAKIAATCCVGEDSVGIWVAGALLPGLDELRAARLRSTSASGDWRAHEGGGLELCAIALVNVPGFPIPRARVASGAPMALVAAGMVQVERGQVAFARRVDPAWKRTLSVGKLTAGAISAGLRMSAAMDGRVLNPAELADQIAERLDERRRAGELTAQQQALIADLDESPARAAALLAELDESESRFAAAVAAFEAGDGGPKGLTA